MAQGNEKYMAVRRATLNDLPYFARSVQTFIQYTPFKLSVEDFLDNMVQLIYDPNVMTFTNGTGHSSVRLTHSFYCHSEVIARVFMTWGEGGLACFRACEEWAREKGASHLISDCLIEPRIAKFYERNGMTRADQIYIKEL